jgi:hypothetical protein
MQNGHEQTPAPAGSTRQINTQQAAQYGLMFLSRVSHTYAERQWYDDAQGLLNAIASGQVILVPQNAMPAMTATPGEAATQ